MINCNGIYYRVYKATWEGVDGGIYQGIALHKRRDISCPGCPECEKVHKYVLECVNENAINLDRFASDTIVEPILSLWRDKETGNINDFDVRLVEAKI